jgi:hypothetical protein
MRHEFGAPNALKAASVAQQLHDPPKLPVHGQMVERPARCFVAGNGNDNGNGNGQIAREPPCRRDQPD